jgi:hypothetical protein
MDNIISLEFIYKSKKYYALVRTKMIGQEKHNIITVMNGDLETLLYGHHILVEDDGILRSSEITNKEVAELKQCSTNALHEHLQENRSINKKEHAW